MTRRHDTRVAADGIALAALRPARSGRSIRAALVLAAAVAAACAGPRAPAPISHRNPLPTATAPVAVAPATDAATTAAVPAVAAPAPAPAPGVEAAPVVAGRVESRPLGGTQPLPAPNAADALRQTPSGLKRPYSDEAFAAVAPTPGTPPADTATPPPGAPGPATAPTPTPAPAPNASAPAPASRAVGTDNGGKFAWPVEGRLVQRFTDAASMGIAIEAAAGSAVRAADGGKVIFSGRGPRNYGNLVIVKHPDDLLSVYAHNSKLLVKEGENVKRGQKIAEVGASGTDSARLGFEVRRQGKPIDPLDFLRGG